MPFNWKQEKRLLPGYIILILWIAFTAAVLGWVVAASLSTTAEIFSGNVMKFPSGLHFENYKKVHAQTNKNPNAVRQLDFYLR